MTVRKVPARLFAPPTYNAGPLVERDAELARAINQTIDEVAGLGAPGGISDGDKGDITVSSSGTVWTLDNATVGVSKLSASGTPSVSTFLRGDNQWATPAATVADGDYGDISVAAGIWSVDLLSITRGKLSASGSAGVTSFLRGDYQWVELSAYASVGAPADAVQAHSVLSTAHGISTFGSSLVSAGTAASARTVLGLGTLATVSPGGTPDGTKFLRDDNSWVVPTSSVADGSITRAKLSASASAGVNTYLRGDFQWVDKYTLVATLASDASSAANTNNVTLSGLAWNYAANSVYFFDWRGQCMTGATTTGVGFNVDVTTAVTEISGQFYHMSNNAGAVTGGSFNADATSLGLSSNNNATATNFPVSGQGILRTGANTGTAQLMFRAEVAATATAKAGLTLVVEKVA